MSNTSPTASLPEVYAVIYFSDYSKKEARFDTCEAAWTWEITERRTAARRRSKADRLSVRFSLYAGCTVTGKSYGGVLHGRDQYSELTCLMAFEERRQARAVGGTWVAAA